MNKRICNRCDKKYRSVYGGKVKATGNPYIRADLCSDCYGEVVAFIRNDAGTGERQNSETTDD